MRWLDGIANFNGHEIEQTLADSGGYRSLACCSPWGHKGSDMTQQLNNNQIKDVWVLRAYVYVTLHDKQDLAGD